ncbi:MAG TPA: ferredoxin reductase family protein [Stackebrandtia sp.]|jgi:predicted ferric reductase|uniref:ferredoxin reductase family protein n=1 Tax=Stackebrandtia sp. TaxID=2023065 RepID=UPI002D2FD2DE|nr:ferredoxin reductase family protein [Stackebrandtia sp.]HZE39168.1 ferredoxin reductase family protein [Stackebrandtia sp.]
MNGVYVLDAPLGARNHRRQRRGRVRLAPLTTLAAMWCGLAAVIGLWWFDTATLSGTAGWLTGAGQITGLMAGYSCAVLLLLMARVPLLDRAIGTDRMARWHAMAGRYTICLVAAHVALVIAGIALTARASVIGEAATVVLTYPDMINAAIAFGLLVATGVISARAARSRLSYETWHYLHLATYLAIFLAFAHQLSNGSDFVGNGAARAAWYTLYLSVAAALVWFRFLAPVRNALRHRLRVAEVRAESPGVVSIYITGHQLDRLGARAGQFFRWRFLAKGLWWTANPYSLSAAPNPQYLRITVRGVGDHSRALFRLRPGTRVWAEGPYGGLTARLRSTNRSLLIAGGIGITPLRALMETLPGDITLLYRCRRADDLPLRAEIDALAAARHATVHYVVDGMAWGRAMSTAVGLRRMVMGLSEHDVYLCGPPGMTSAIAETLRDAGVPRGRIHYESFAL